MVSRTHITTKRDRRSRKYLELHRQLRNETYRPEPSRQQRHKAAAAVYRQCGEM